MMSVSKKVLHLMLYAAKKYYIFSTQGRGLVVNEGDSFL